jgi:hypothetical protein
MHYTPINVPPSYPISAVYKNTAPSPTSPWVMPGEYTARLTVDGNTYQQSFSIKMDPRVKTSLKDLQQQHDLSLMAYENSLQIMNALNELHDLRKKLKIRIADATGAAITDLNQCDQQAAAFENTPQGSRQQSFEQLDNIFTTVFNNLQESEMPATSQTIAAATDAERSFKTLWIKWVDVKKKIQKCLGEK